MIAQKVPLLLLLFGKVDVNETAFAHSLPYDDSIQSKYVIWPMREIQTKFGKPGVSFNCDVSLFNRLRFLRSQATGVTVTLIGS